MTTKNKRKKKIIRKKYVMDEFGGRELSIAERIRRLRK